MTFLQANGEGLGAGRFRAGQPIGEFAECGGDEELVVVAAAAFVGQVGVQHFPLGRAFAAQGGHLFASYAVVFGVLAAALLLSAWVCRSAARLHHHEPLPGEWVFSG